MRKLIVSMIDLIIFFENQQRASSGRQRLSNRCCPRQISEAAKRRRSGVCGAPVSCAPNAIKHAFPTANKLPI
jgi:hypothetical protein